MSVKRLEPGQSFAGYEIEACLGSGGMGAVYLARRGPQLLALKLCQFHDERALARFEREAVTLAQLGQVANIVAIHSYDARGETPYLAMDYIAGEDLESRVGRLGPLDEVEALGLIAKLARSLHEVHSRGIVHRDIKPANILIRDDGEPYLTDFGLSANSSCQGLTATGEVLGTPRCMAPEQLLAAEVSPATDVWALGVTLYFCLSGQWPFRAESSVELAAQIINGQPSEADGRGFSKKALGLIHRALAKGAADRYASALDFAIHCESSGTCSRSRLPLLALALLGIALLVVPLIVWMQREALKHRLMTQLESSARRLQLEQDEDELLTRCLLLRLRGPELELTRTLSAMGESWSALADAGFTATLSANLASRMSQAAVLEGQLKDLPKRLSRFMPKRWQAGLDGEGQMGPLLVLMGAAKEAAGRGQFSEAQGLWQGLLDARRRAPAQELREVWRCCAAPSFAVAVFAENTSLGELERGLASWFFGEPLSLAAASLLNQVLADQFRDPALSTESGARALELIDQLSRRWPILRPRVASRFHRALIETSKNREPTVLLYHKAQAALADSVEILPAELDPDLLYSNLGFQQEVERSKGQVDGSAALRLAAELASAGLILPIETYGYWDPPKTLGEAASPVFAERPWDHGYQLWAFIKSCRGSLTDGEVKERRLKLEELLERPELNEQLRASARVYYCYASMARGPRVPRSEREAIALELRELVDAPLARPEEVCLTAMALHIDLFIEETSAETERRARALHQRLRKFAKERCEKKSFTERSLDRPAWAPLAFCDVSVTNGRALEGELMFYRCFAKKEADEDDAFRELVRHACLDHGRADKVMVILVVLGHLKRAQRLMEALQESAMQTHDPQSYETVLNLLPAELQAKFRSP